MTDRYLLPDNWDRIQNCRSRILLEVVVERMRQRRIHGVRTLKMETWLMYVTEELGEVARAIQELDAKNLKEEAVQSMALLMAMLEQLEVGSA